MNLEPGSSLLSSLRLALPSLLPYRSVPNSAPSRPVPSRTVPHLTIFSHSVSSLTVLSRSLKSRPALFCPVSFFPFCPAPYRIFLSRPDLSRSVLSSNFLSNVNYLRDSTAESRHLKLVYSKFLKSYYFLLDLLFRYLHFVVSNPPNFIILFLFFS